MEYTHIHIHPEQNQNSSANIKYNRLTQRTKESKNYIYQNKTNQSTNWKTKLKQGANQGINNENKTNKYVERKGEKEKKGQTCNLNRDR